MIAKDADDSDMSEQFNRVFKAAARLKDVTKDNESLDFLGSKTSDRTSKLFVSFMDIRQDADFQISFSETRLVRPTSRHVSARMWLSCVIAFGTAEVS